MIEGKIEQEDKTLVNIYTHSRRIPKHIEQIFTDKKGKINNNTVLIGTFSSHLYQWIDRPDRK